MLRHAPSSSGSRIDDSVAASRSAPLEPQKGHHHGHSIHHESPGRTRRLRAHRGWQRQPAGRTDSSARLTSADGTGNRDRVTGSGGGRHDCPDP